MAMAITYFANNKSCLVYLRVNTQIFQAASQATKEAGPGVVFFFIALSVLWLSVTHFKHTQGL